jgi:hypothetical protein
LVTSLSISSKISCNVASRSNFDINSIDPVSLESIPATEKEWTNIQDGDVDGDVFITFAALAVVPINYSSGGTQVGLELERVVIILNLLLPNASGGGM